jgi:hypothetical protein
MHIRASICLEFDDPTNIQTNCILKIHNRGSRIIKATQQGIIRYMWDASFWNT